MLPAVCRFAAEHGERVGVGFQFVDPGTHEGPDRGAQRHGGGRASRNVAPAVAGRVIPRARRA